MAKILSSSGYSVTVAEDGQAAWEELAREPAHLLLLDIEMPRLDGCEVCRRVKSHPRTKAIPVMLLSGRPDVGSQARAAGADSFLNKPFSIKALQVQVETLLGGKPSAQGDPMKNHAKLLKQADSLRNQMSLTAASVVAYRETSGDYGDMSQQGEQEWLFLSQNRANARELAKIELALKRIDAGTYGSCARCTAPISPQRLRAIPWAECCVECQDQASGSQSATA